MIDELLIAKILIAFACVLTAVAFPLTYLTLIVNKSDTVKSIEDALLKLFILTTLLAPLTFLVYLIPKVFT